MLEPVVGGPVDALTSTFSAASVRGVYLWGGDATVALHREKFPDFAIDVAAHDHAHTTDAARVLARTGINVAFLSMNWGFPPEIEEPFWLQFEQAARAYREDGLRVIAYVQASNCVATGTYARRDWYARTPAGRTIPYFRNRLMTCWNHPQWIEEVGSHARRGLEAGADGVFFDNLWMGATPWVLGHEPGGFAGCFCEGCRSAFRTATGFELPRRIVPGAPITRTLLDWRVAIVQRRLGEWSRIVRQGHPDAWILANNCDVMLRPTSELFGLEPAALAPAQTALLVENVAMPRLDAAANMLVGNALPLRALRAVAPGRAIFCVTYERGIGLDRTPPTSAFVRAVAEAAALGACPILKGSEYLDPRGRFTVLTAAALAETRHAVAPMLQWLADNPALFEATTPDPDILLLYDEEAFRHDFARAATATFAIATALVAEGVPFEFVTRTALEASGPDRPVIVPPRIRPPPASRGAVDITIEDLYPVRLPNGLMRNRTVHRLVDPFLAAFSRAYFGSAGVRRFVDGTGVTASFLRSRFFRLPADTGRLRARIPGLRPTPRAASPVLVERRVRADGSILFHLVNYVDAPAQVRMPVMHCTPVLHSADVSSGFDGDDRQLLWLECYAVLEYRPPADRQTD